MGKYKTFIVIILLVITSFMLIKQENSNKFPLSKAIIDFDTIYTGLVAYMNTKPASKIIFVKNDFDSSGSLKNYINPEILPGSGQGDPWGREYNYTVLDGQGNIADRGSILVVWSQGNSENEEIPARFIIKNGSVEEIEAYPGRDEKIWAVYYISDNNKIIYERSNALVNIKK